MRHFGLIGEKLGHSFSKFFFENKWAREGIHDCQYDLFEIPDIHKLKEVIRENNLTGLNVTVPYKEQVMPFVDELDGSARKVGAVNVLSFGRDGRITGYNSDYFGFRESLTRWAPVHNLRQAFVLGTGGASKAVQAVLHDLGLPFRLVSRRASERAIDYSSVSFSQEETLVVNTTPLGMYPLVEDLPRIPYQQLSDKSYLYDLVYNPKETFFMKEGRQCGAQVKNGEEMLELQAEKSWEIWCSQ